MTKGIVSFNDNWADEMDINSLILIGDFDIYIKGIKKFQDLGLFAKQIYFGTNEFNEYESFTEFWSKFTFEQITDEEYKILTNFLGNGSGHMLDPLEIVYDAYYDLLEKNNEIF